MADTQTTTQADKNNLSGGQIALIIIGCILVIGLVALFVSWLVGDKKKKKSGLKTQTIQIGGPVNKDIKKQNNVAKTPTPPQPVRASVVRRYETVAAPTESMIPTKEELGYISSEETEEQPDMYEKLGLLAGILNEKPKEKTEEPEKKEEKKEEVKKEEEKAKKEEPDKNEKPNEENEKPKEENEEKAKKEDDIKENNDKQVAKENAEDDEELDLDAKAPPFGDVGPGKISNPDDKISNPDDKKNGPEKKQYDDVEDDPALKQLFGMIGLGGGNGINQTPGPSKNKPFGNLGNMPGMPKQMGPNMPMQATKPPFDNPMQKSDGGLPMQKSGGGLFGAGGFSNTNQSSPEMFNSGQNNGFQNVPANMVPPPPMPSFNPSMNAAPGPYQNGNPMMHDDRGHNNDNGADFSFSETEEQQPVQPNNNQSKINLGIQNKCNCPSCTGGGN